ncbi:MAG: hypothetical protein ACLR6B_00380 [Blautia sp.]
MLKPDFVVDERMTEAITHAIVSAEALVRWNSPRKEGISTLLDDFGSGVSYFSTLRDYEFDIIKLDMAFGAEARRE